MLLAYRLNEGRGYETLKKKKRNKNNNMVSVIICRLFKFERDEEMNPNTKERERNVSGVTKK